MFGATHRPWRSLFLLAGAALLLVQPFDLVVADRNSATCVQTCNTLKEVCRDMCREDCAALFPVGSPEFNACNSACQEECSADQFECKAKCNVNRIPPHSPEP